MIYYNTLKICSQSFFLRNDLSFLLIASPFFCAKRRKKNSRRHYVYSCLKLNTYTCCITYTRENVRDEMFSLVAGTCLFAWRVVRQPFYRPGDFASATTWTLLLPLTRSSPLSPAPWVWSFAGSYNDEWIHKSPWVCPWYKLGTYACEETRGRWRWESWRWSSLSLQSPSDDTKRPLSSITANRLTGKKKTKPSRAYNDIILVLLPWSQATGRRDYSWYKRWEMGDSRITFSFLFTCPHLLVVQSLCIMYTCLRFKPPQ